MFLDLGRKITKINKSIRNFRTLTKFLRVMRLQRLSFLQNRNMLKDIIIDEANMESITDLENIFCVQTLLRRYAPCEHNSTDKVRYSSQSLIKIVQCTQVNKQYFISLIVYKNELKQNTFWQKTVLICSNKTKQRCIQVRSELIQTILLTSRLPVVYL